MENCVTCFESISNPICVRCYSKQITSWLSYNHVNIAISQKIIKRIKKSQRELLSDTTCIKCNIEPVYTCTYCYFFKVELILRSYNFQQGLIEDFSQFFNYKIYDNVFTSG